MGSASPYAAIHQLGGTINKPGRAAKIYRMKDRSGPTGRRFVLKGKADDVTDVQIPAHWIVIPARPFIGVSTDDQGDILAMTEDWLTR